LDKEIKKSLMKLIERRREKSSVNKTHQDSCPKDLLGLMIQASNSCTDVTVHDIVEECKSFFFAGQHTTSNLLTWTTVLLAMHPQWQAQAREEVLRVCGSRDTPTKDDVAKLKTVKPPSKTCDKILVLSLSAHCFFPVRKKNTEKTTLPLFRLTAFLSASFFVLVFSCPSLSYYIQYRYTDLYSELENQQAVVAFSSFHLHAESCYGVQLAMILNESLRLYPPTIATIRRSKADVELGGYKVPSGTEILIPILALHHDQSIWGNDANEFNPARFSGGVARAAKHHVAFIPFGLGVRTCIGQNLAILQAKLTLAILLQRFSFRLAPSYQHAPTVLMLLYPQYGAPIIFQHLSNP
jgi:cytochrome P450